MIIGIAALAALIPYIPLIALISIALILLSMGAINPNGIYIKAIWILFALYIGFSLSIAYLHSSSDQFSRPLFFNILSGFPITFIAIIFILFVGTFIRGLILPPKDTIT